MSIVSHAKFCPECTVIVIAMIAFFIIAVVASIKHGQEKEAFLKSNSCQLTEKIKTGKQIYCGKACFRPEIKEVYICSFGEHIIIN